MTESRNYIDGLIRGGEIIVDGDSISESQRNDIINSLVNIASIESGRGFIERMIESDKPFHIVNDPNVYGGNAGGSGSIGSIEELRELLDDNKIFINVSNFEEGNRIHYIGDDYELHPFSLERVIIHEALGHELLNLGHDSNIGYKIDDTVEQTNIITADLGEVNRATYDVRDPDTGRIITDQNLGDYRDIDWRSKLQSINGTESGFDRIDAVDYSLPFVDRLWNGVEDSVKLYWGVFRDVIVGSVRSIGDAVVNVFQFIFGGSEQSDIPSSQINNSLLDLTINTDLTQDFRPSSNPTQTGNAIDGGDYYIESDIDVLNGDGAQNTTPMGILTDQYRPGNVELSTSEGFAREVAENIVLLNQGQGYDVLADLINQSIDARTFLNIDPVILDLNNNNQIDLISYQNSQVTFDVDNDNRSERTGWVNGDDGILVHDKNGDGVINNITETISEYYSLTDQEWQNILSEQGVANQNQRNPFRLNPFDNKYSNHGLEALKKLDTNQDNKLDANDAIFDQLKVWQDENEDGVTDSGELRTLTQAEIREFDLSNILEIDRQRNEGNVVLAQSFFTTINGQTRLTQAVDFTTNPIGYEFNDVNLGTLATSEEGTKSLAISDEGGARVLAADENVQNIFGNAGDDEIIGDDGNNWLSGSGGSDILSGGDGDDILIIDEYDLQQNIDGGDGRDIVIINSDRSVSFNLTDANVETAIGGNGDDVLIGGGLANVFIDGGNGDDVIIGGAADDALSGSNGDDLIDGGYGDDVLRGHRGEDLIVGGLGDDLIDGGLGDDNLSGNEGNDIIIGGKGDDEIDGGAGYDLAKYSGSYNNYQIYKEGDVVRVRHLTTQDIDTLENIEGIRFDDATIRIEENSAPLAVADQILVNGNQNEIIISKESLLSNDIDLERGDVDIRSVENVVGGAVELVRDEDGEITGVRFTPDQGFSGVMSFDYSIIDDQGAYSQVTLHNNDGTSQQANHKARVQFKLNDDPSDPLYYDQWYSSEINVKGVWDEYKGDGVTVGVFEDGDFNRHHQDLDENIVENHVEDQEFRQVEVFSQHKTTVAGVIAALNNDYGIIGVAPEANLDGYGWGADREGLANLKNVDVANNSWGVDLEFADNFSDPSNYSRAYARFIEESAKDGRDGLGTVNVFAGGNQRQDGDNVNYHNLQNSRFVIATGSINQEGDLGALVEASTPFSNPGSAILVSAPGSNIQSTGNLLENANGSTFLGEFSASQGTSFSAPIISGIVALMLEAKPNLGYRDVQKILAYSARKFEDENTVWLENGADNFNGGALHYSEDYGFGIVDAKAAVRLAESWGEINNYYNENSLKLLDATDYDLQDNGTFESNFEISDSNIHNIENVEVLVDIAHDDISQLKLILISPNGTRSILMNEPQDSAYEGGLKFNFSSRHFLGEDADGQWRLQIIDGQEGDVGLLKSWELKLYGKLDDGQDDVYIYTNEIVTLNNSARSVIRDNDGGIDTINAVAVDGDNVINLNPGNITRLNGEELTISSNQFNAEYLQRQSQLESQIATLRQKESQLQSARDSIPQKEAEFESLGRQLPIKRQEYEEINERFQVALVNFNQARSWFDNHEYSNGINYGGGNIVYFFVRQSDGATISISQRDYDAKVNDYNAKLNIARSLESQRNNAADEYNALLARYQAIPQKIQDTRNQAEDLYQQVQDAQNDVDNTQNFLNSFNDENNTIIENAYSGDGDDRLIGNDLDNRLMAGRGENTLTGGEGRDIFVIKKGATSDTITDFEVGEDKIDVSEFETSFDELEMTQDGVNVVVTIGDGQEIILQNTNLIQVSQSFFKFQEVDAGTAGDDIIQGANNDDVIDGGDGNDLIQSFGGNDRINGGDGNDRIYGGSGDDIIFDGDGKDVVYGGDGNDIIHIQDGNQPNVTISGAFSEIDAGFFGGRGDDTFVIAYNAAGGGFLNNLIYDFELDNENEKIDLSAFRLIRDISDLNLGNININGQQYTRVTIPDNDNDFTNNVNFTLKGFSRDALSNHNFIFAENEAPNITDNRELANNFLSENIFINSVSQNKGELPALEHVDGVQVDPDPISSHVMTMDRDGEAIVTFKNSVAGYKNTIGWYQIGENGEMLNPQLLFKNAKLIESDTEFSLGNLERGVKIGFFLIANGGKANFLNLDSDEKIGMNRMDLDQGDFSFVNSDGEVATIFDNSSPELLFTNNETNQGYNLDKYVYHSYNNVDLNPDRNLHGGAGWDSQREELLLGFEDLYGGGDRDYNDILFYFRIDGDRDFKQFEYVNAPSINILLEDDNQINGVVIDLTNAQGGDRLVFDNNRYIIDEDTGNISYIEDLENAVMQDLSLTITFDEENDGVIISGLQSVDIYQDIVNSIRLINVSVDGDGEGLNLNRNISIEVTDEYDLSSTIDTQIIITGDPIFGSNQSDTLTGTVGNDVIIAKLGNDMLQGGLGSDVLKGGGGNDNLVGGLGADILTGGFGLDSFNFTSLDDSTINQSDLITDFTQGEDSINFSNFGFVGIQEGQGQGDVLGYNYDSDLDITVIEDVESDFAIKLSGRFELDEGDFVF